MKLTELDKFREEMLMLCASYREEIDEATTMAYWLTLSDLPLGRIKAAVVEAMRTKKFMPKAAELRELALAAIDQEARAERIAAQTKVYTETLARSLVEGCRRLGWDDARIDSELTRVGEEAGAVLAWPDDIARQAPAIGGTDDRA